MRDSSHQKVSAITLPADSNVMHAVQCSGIMEKYPEIDLANNKVGIFGNIVSLEHVLSDNDRIEIYRPLQIGPMEARRLRAELNK